MNVLSKNYTTQLKEKEKLSKIKTNQKNLYPPSQLYIGR